MGTPVIGLAEILVILLITVALLVALYIIVARASKKSPSGNSQASSDEQALHILKERYARGEIDQEEYRQMKKDLKG